MAVLTVRNLSDEVHRALRLLATRNGRSTEAEVREILSNTVKPEQRPRMGAAMAAMARENGLTDEDILALEQAMAEARNDTPAEPLELV
jgi:plasmid stability protein